MKQPKESASLYMWVVCVFNCEILQEKRERKSQHLWVVRAFLYEILQRGSISISMWVVCIFIYETLCISLCELLVFSPVKPFKTVSISMWLLLCFLLWNCLNCQWLRVFSYGTVWIVSGFTCEMFQNSQHLCVSCFCFHLWYTAPLWFYFPLSELPSKLTCSEMYS